MSNSTKKTRAFSLGIALAALLTPGLSRGGTKLLWNFEHGTDGFTGQVAQSTLDATSGSHSLEIKSAGSTGWNQNLAIVSSGLPDFTKDTELLMDVTVPQGTFKADGYLQIIPTFSGPKNGFYQLSKTDLKQGLNHLSFPFDGRQVATPWKLYLILNSGDKLAGSIYVDNIRAHSPGGTGTLSLKLTDQYGRPLAGAFLAIGTKLAQADAQGDLTVTLAGDHYQAEILGRGFPAQHPDFDVPEGSTLRKTLAVPVPAPQPDLSAHVWVMPGTVWRSFDAHDVYGCNTAIWNGVGPFQDAASLRKIEAARLFFIRFPGGDYGNLWDWRNGTVYHPDGTVDWKPDANWNTYVQFMKKLGPQAEMLMIANIMNMQPQDTLDWIASAKARGVNLRWVELGNEPDLKPDMPFQGQKDYWTYIDHYVARYLLFAKAIRAAYPDIKLMGPCISQIEYRECPGGQPWTCEKDPGKPFWIKEFLRKAGPYVDAVSFHSYPYYTTGAMEPDKLFATTGEFAQWFPRWRRWMKEYDPGRDIKIAMTEYNVQVAENSTTVKLIDGVWLANFLAEFIKNGGDIANYWDFNTTKQGDGGGHGMLDPSGDPTRPYAERATYWSMKLMSNYFTGKMVRAVSNNPQLPAYAAQDKGRLSVLVVNRSPDRAARVDFQLMGDRGARVMTWRSLSRQNYLWCSQLYRAVVNTGPSEVRYGVPGNGLFSLTLQPMSVNMITME